MHKALEIAKYVVNRSKEIGSPISNLKLQKLLYYIQAASLVENNEKCFDDKITAWEYGPVVVPVYQAFREYGRGEIPVQSVSKEMKFDPLSMKIIYATPKEIEAKHKRSIDKVIRAYSDVSDPYELVKKTHQEEPWQKTKINNEIRSEQIKSYYKANADKIYG